MPTTKHQQYVIACAGTRNNYFLEVQNGKIKTVSKKSEAYKFNTIKYARSMCLTLSMAGYPSDVRKV
jgi:hypothetical protein